MIRRFRAFRGGLTVAAVVCLALGYAAPAAAFNFGNMMNPGKWFGGGNRDRYDDYGSYGYDMPPPPGYGYGVAPYGYGAPGYGAAPYGAPYGAAPPGSYGYGQPAPAVAPAPAAAPAKQDDSDVKIRQLERRIKELEAAASQPQFQSMAPYPGQPQYPGQAQPYPSAPGMTFRPMDPMGGMGSMGGMSGMPGMGNP